MSNVLKIQQELLDAGEAALYLGCSRSYFDEHLRRLLPCVDLSGPKSKNRQVRYAKSDLDAFIASRRNAVA
jgi:predicted DNA-binding transcriptional regulator AlpA